MLTWSISVYFDIVLRFGRFFFITTIAGNNAIICFPEWAIEQTLLQVRIHLRITKIMAKLSGLQHCFREIKAWNSRFYKELLSCSTASVMSLRKHYDYDGLYSVKFKILYTSLISYFLIQNALAKNLLFKYSCIRYCIWCLDYGFNLCFILHYASS